LEGEEKLAGSRRGGGGGEVDDDGVVSDSNEDGREGVGDSRYKAKEGEESDMIAPPGFEVSLRLYAASWGCVVLCAAVWCCVVLCGAVWCCVVLCVIQCGALWCCAVL